MRFYYNPEDNKIIQEEDRFDNIPSKISYLPKKLVIRYIKELEQALHESRVHDLQEKEKNEVV